MGEIKRARVEESRRKAEIRRREAAARRAAAARERRKKEKREPVVRLSEAEKVAMELKMKVAALWQDASCDTLFDLQTKLSSPPLAVGEDNPEWFKAFLDNLIETVAVQHV